jgi:D-glycerate 3-kinase
VDHPLLHMRRQPDTHDERLIKEFFDCIGDDTSPQLILLPVFDKSLFRGKGDRLPKERWKIVPRTPPLEVLIFEGCCVTFRPLTDDELVVEVAAA